MSKGIIAIVILVVSGLIYPFFIDPLLKETNSLRSEIKGFEDTILKIGEFNNLRDELVIKSEEFTSDELEKLDKILPDRIDAFSQIVDLEAIIKQNGLFLEDVITFETNRSGSKNKNKDKENVINPRLFSFVVVGGYSDMISFLDQISRSLVLYDIAVFDFELPEAGSLYKFNITLRTNEINMSEDVNQI